mmetsp:Transcript_13258/g.43698  ORF Transcript_13258/g.43698 Transcript_13258/m.43698 type:complete len:268 (-) Transcript_13258:1300-2103(-)
MRRALRGASEALLLASAACAAVPGPGERALGRLRSERVLRRRRESLDRGRHHRRRFCRRRSLAGSAAAEAVALRGVHRRRALVAAVRVHWAEVALPGRGDERLRLVRPVVPLLRAGERDEALLEVRERAFDVGFDVLLDVDEQLVPQRLLREHFRVANHDEAVTSACHRHVQAARVVQEADSRVFVRANAGEDDEILLATLERIHGSHFEVLVELLSQHAILGHVVDDVGALPFVRRDDANLVRRHAALQKVGHRLLNSNRFGAVQV